VAGRDVVGVTFECDYPPEACSRRIVSTSTLPSNLSAAEIDTAVSAALARGEDLYYLDRDALADLDPDVVVTQDLVRCALLTSVSSTMRWRFRLPSQGRHDRPTHLGRGRRVESAAG
jgi:iron complex transport system substrate-binding protein